MRHVRRGACFGRTLVEERTIRSIYRRQGAGKARSGTTPRRSRSSRGEQVSTFRLRAVAAGRGRLGRRVARTVCHATVATNIAETAAESTAAAEPRRDARETAVHVEARWTRRTRQCAHRTGRDVTRAVAIRGRAITSAVRGGLTRIAGPVVVAGHGRSRPRPRARAVRTMTAVSGTAVHLVRGAGAISAMAGTGRSVRRIVRRLRRATKATCDDERHRACGSRKDPGRMPLHARHRTKTRLAINRKNDPVALG